MLLRIGLRIVSAIVLYIAGCASLMADTVYLADGSVLKGDIKLLRDGELSLATAYAGELTLDADDVAGLETDEAMILRRDSGDPGRARFFVSDDGQQFVAGGDGAARPFDVAQIVDLRPQGAPSPQQVARRKQQEAAAERADKLWSGRLEVGVDGASGNSKNQTINARGMVKRETGDNRATARAEVHKASQEGEDTEDEIRANARIEQDFTENAFVFTEAEAERDQFEEVDLRYRLTVGPGYFLLQEPDHVLKTRLGLGFEQERFDDGETNENFIATLGYDYRVDLWDYFRLTHELTILPEIDSEPSENYRVESILGAELPLGSTDSPWRLRGELRHDYDHNPEPGVETTDTSYGLSIVRDFR